MVALLTVEGELQRLTNAELFNFNSSWTPVNWPSTARTTRRRRRTCRWSATTDRCIRTRSVLEQVRECFRGVCSTTPASSAAVMVTRTAGAATSTTTTLTSTIYCHHHCRNLVNNRHRHVTTRPRQTTIMATRLAPNSRRLITWPDVYWLADSTTWRLKTGYASKSAKTEKYLSHARRTAFVVTIAINEIATFNHARSLKS